MLLTSYLRDLLETGSVTVGPQPAPFEEEDLREAAQILRDFYLKDLLNLPGKAPAFSEEAALWAARYLYTATQCIMLRDLSAEEVQTQLRAFGSEITHEAIYSADLCLRHLPVLLHLSKGLAPGDILVKCLMETALLWPFSSVGMKMDGEPEHEKLLGYASLKYAYADRIILMKDKKRSAYPGINPLIAEALGNYKDELWPEFELLTDDLIDENKQ
ncbi:MAG: hypothetical protein ACJ75J_14090 [Cytophagaceae bacterium]